MEVEDVQQDLSIDKKAADKRLKIKIAGMEANIEASAKCGERDSHLAGRLGEAKKKLELLELMGQEEEDGK